MKTSSFLFLRRQLEPDSDYEQETSVSLLFPTRHGKKHPGYQQHTPQSNPMHVYLKNIQLSSVRPNPKYILYVFVLPSFGTEEGLFEYHGEPERLIDLDLNQV